MSGFDVPDCECVVLLRATQSLTLYIQSSTRCLRPNGDKKSIVIDMVGNCFRHGMPTADRQWSLKSKVKEYYNEDEKGNFIIRVCQNCFGTFPQASICPYCGAKYEITPIEIQNFKEIELKKIEEERAARMQKWRDNLDKKVSDYRNPSECKTWGELVAFARIRNFKPGYAYVMAKKYGIPVGRK